MKSSKKIWFNLIAVLAVLGASTEGVAGWLTSSDGIPFKLCSVKPYVGDTKVESYTWPKGAHFIVGDRDQAIFNDLMSYLDNGAPQLSFSGYVLTMGITNPEGTAVFVNIQINTNETIFIKEKEMGVEKVIMTATFPSPIATIGKDSFFPDLKIILDIRTVCGDSNGDLKLQ